MYYGKKKIVQTIKRGSVTIKDFSAGMNGFKDPENLSHGECAFSYNFNMNGGTLKDGKGVKRADYLVCPIFDIEGVTPIRLYYYKKYNTTTEAYEEFLLIYADDNNTYKVKIGEDSFTCITDLTFSSPPYAVAYNYMSNDVMIFSTGSTMKVYDGETVVSVTDVPAVTSMCIHSERLFATDDGTRTSLWFSDDFNPLNWKISLNDAGFIDIREGAGSLIKVVSFGGFLYVFANYGIVRVMGSGSQTDFTVDGIAASSGKIIKNSIAVCGDRIIYLAEDGFYMFKGGSPTRIMNKLDGKIVGIDNSDAKACYFNGSYYCKLKMMSDIGVKDVFVKYDIQHGFITVMSDLDIVDLVVADGEESCKLLFLIKNKRQPATLSDKAEKFSVPLYKHWVSGISDLGESSTKHLTRLSLKTATEITVAVESERGKRVLHFFGSSERQSRTVGLKGDCFTITIDCHAPDAKISALKAEYEY